MFECGIGSGEGPKIQFHEEDRALLVPALLVEECSELAEIIEPIFSGLGFQAQWASSEAEAIDIFAKTGEGLIVFSDSVSPRGSGLAQEFRKRERAFTYILCTSQMRGRENKFLAYSDGVDDYLRKPLDQEEFFYRLRVARRLLVKEAEDAKQRSKWEEAAQQSLVMNHALLVATQRFGELFDGLPMACFTFGPDGSIQDWNRAAEKQFGIAGYVAYQNRVQDVFKNTNGVWDDAHIDKIFLQERSTAFDWSLSLLDGSVRDFACTLFILRSPEGEAQGVISSNLDITERKLAEQKIQTMANDLAQKQSELLVANRRLAELAKTDTLTGLANRRAFEDLLTLELAEAEKAFSLLMIDVDHFKSFNDTYGHQVGDDVLRMVATAIREVTRGEETACRFGGEEFVVLLPHTDEHRSLARAEAFRSAVEHAPWVHRPVTISVGVATRSFDGPTPHDYGVTVVDDATALVQEADAALYASKESGRNRVTHAWSRTIQDAA